MSVPELSKKAFISVAEMAEMLSLSKSRFFGLMKVGVFPRPIQHPSCKRPIFDLELQQKCLEIRQNGIGLHGQPVIFNRMKRNPRTRRQQPQPAAHHDEHADLIEALKSLGLTTTSEAVAHALTEIYPSGVPSDKGQVIRAVFLHLRAKKV